MEDAMQIVHYGNLSASTVLIQPVCADSKKNSPHVSPRSAGKGMWGILLGDFYEAVRLSEGQSGVRIL